MALITASQFLDFVDARTVAGRLLDTGRPAGDGEMLDATTTAGRRLSRALRAAERMLMSACAVSDRYTRAELEVIAADDDKNGLLHFLLAGLADGIILHRRRLPAEQFDKLAPCYAEALGYLDQLRDGNRIFDDVPEQPRSGLPAAVDFRTRPGRDEPSLVDNHRLFGVLSPAVRPGPGGCRGNWS